MPISQDQITTLDQLEEKLTLALTDLLLLRDSNNEDYKVKASTILQAAVDKAGAELIGGNVESGNTKAVTGDTVNTALAYTKLSAAGSTGISLAGVTYKEMVVEVETSNASFTFNIIKDMLTTNAKYFRDGYYYNTSTTAICTIRAVTDSITLANLYINGVDEIANATINVFYK